MRLLKDDEALEQVATLAGRDEKGNVTVGVPLYRIVPRSEMRESGLSKAEEELFANFGRNLVRAYRNEIAAAAAQE